MSKKIEAGQWRDLLYEIENSVSTVRNDYWNASAYCHIGHRLQLLSRLKHKEMIPILEKRIKTCKEQVNKEIYQQY